MSPLQDIGDDLFSRPGSEGGISIWEAQRTVLWLKTLLLSSWDNTHSQAILPGTLHGGEVRIDLLLLKFSISHLITSLSRELLECMIQGKRGKEKETTVFHMCWNRCFQSLQGSCAEGFLCWPQWLRILCNGMSLAQEGAGRKDQVIHAKRSLAYEGCVLVGKYPIPCPSLFD